MPDISTTFGFVFSVDDQATPGVERAQAAAESAADSLEHSLEGLTTSADSIIGSLGGVVGDAAEEFHALSGEVDQLTNSMVGVGSLGEAFEDPLALIERAEEAMSEFRDFQIALEAQEMAEAFTELGEGLELLAEQIIDNDLPEAIEATGAALGGATTGGVGFLASIRSLVNTVGPAGLVAYLFGPIAPVFALLAPLVALLTNTLLPIFQDFLAIVQNAFAPLQFVLDTLLQSLIPDIQRLMGPLVDMLTFVAVELGVQIQQMFGGIAGVAGPAIQAISGMMPVLKGVFGAIVKVGTKALPLFIDLLNEIVPVLVDLAVILADMFIARMDVLGDMLTELGPDFVGLIGGVLKSLVPLLAVIAEVGNILLTEVFAPIFIPLLKMTLKLLSALAPAMGFILTPVAELLTFIIEKLVVLGENWDRFMIAFPKVKKILDGIKALFDEVFGYVIDKLADLRENWDKFLKAFPEVADVLGINTTEPSEPLPILTPEQFRPEFLEKYQPTEGFGEPEFDVFGRAKFARGGIATGDEGVFGEFGEAGTAEAVVPLDRQHLREFMEPALGELTMAGLDEQTGLLGALVEFGREALAKMDRARESQEERVGLSAGIYDIESDLQGGIGLSGMIPVGG